MLNNFNEVEDLKEEVEVTLKDQIFEGFIIQARIDPLTVPKEYHMYDLREWDEQPEDSPCACEIKNGNIWVNFMGHFFTKTKLPLEVDESFFVENGLDISFV